MDRFGQNRGYIEELYRSYLADPSSVSEAWRDYFADYRPEPRRAASAPAAPATRTAADGEPLRGAAARLAQNMQRSLAVPTATSARTLPVKNLIENRRLINRHQDTLAASRISFTHLIAWALVRALEKHPAMNVHYEEDGATGRRVAHDTVHLGLAVDLERKGERALVVPNIRGAEKLEFRDFTAAMDDRVIRAREGRLSPDDFQDTTVTLTNPGMLGTSLSIPRLMQGQGVIIGTGAIELPAPYAGMAPRAVADLGLSQVMTVTSTYDHRVIQGAESGGFLATLERLLLGEDGFYDRVFADLRVAQSPIRWAADRNPPLAAASDDTARVTKQASVLQLIRAYRVRGHLLADVDPLGYHPQAHAELELASYGLSVWDLDRCFIAGGLGGAEGMLELREILDILHQAYCRHVGVEYMHIQEDECRRWIQERIEVAEPPTLPREDQLRVLRDLNAAGAFESFLATNYVGQKRFSLEGAETLIPMLDYMLSDGADAGIEEVIIGMSHRGRLNVLTNIADKELGQIFREFEGDLDPLAAHGSGDVKYHLGAKGAFTTAAGKSIDVRVASNPSHLEAVDPVVTGMVRAAQDVRGDRERTRVLPLLLHGDAAFSGQGVVAETLNLSQLKGYRTGGTMHIVIDNQIGFTTGPADLRSSLYSTDMAKAVGAPIFHVNGDRPEDAVRVIRLALAYRQRFKRDVVVDLVCYRRWGHNEADDPSYTHPELYAQIESHRSVRKLYTDELLRRGDFDPETAERALEDFRKRLAQVREEVRQAQAARGAADPLERRPPEAAVPDPPTAVPLQTLERVLSRLERQPDGFVVHPKLEKQIARYRQHFEGDRIDWALGEALAFGSLLLEGKPVRLSGEDSGRGTFSQRHTTLYDHRSGTPFTPLAALGPDQAQLQVVDSLLSEFAVLGFEYGYSVGHPEAFVLWEAQFGDFVNGAQVIIDQFIVSAEDKWNQRSGLTLLLPHGYEGQGPEHSSARIERFLQLSADDNIRVAVPSTPAQYYHLLRDQALRRPAKPLVIMTPKSLLRHRDCVSSRAELSTGRFAAALDDPRTPQPSHVRRLVLCSGKVFYDLDGERQRDAPTDIAACRLELLYPFPDAEVRALLERYSAAREVVWLQEEPRNMGPWPGIRDALQLAVGDKRRLMYVGRAPAPSPATGSQRRHVAEQEALVREALHGARNGVPA